MRKDRLQTLIERLPPGSYLRLEPARPGKPAPEPGPAPELAGKTRLEALVALMPGNSFLRMDPVLSGHTGPLDRHITSPDGYSAVIAGWPPAPGGDSPHAH